MAFTARYVLLDMSNSYMPGSRDVFAYTIRYLSLFWESGMKDIVWPLYELMGIVFFSGAAAVAKNIKTSSKCSNSSYSTFIV